MFPRILSKHLHSSILNKVRYPFSSYFFNSHHYIIYSFLSNFPSSFNSSNTINHSSFNYDPPIDNFTLTNSPFNQLILNISYVSPKTCRKFLRISRWKPEHMLELLLGFQLCSQRSSLSLEVVQSLFVIFRRIGEEFEGFKHFPRSCEIMASMLIDLGMLREVESLLYMMEVQGILLNNAEILSSLVEGYVNVGELGKAILIYDKMKGLSLAPSLSCYRSLIGSLVKKGEVDRAISVYEDMIEVGFEFGNVEVKNMDDIIGLLCGEGKVREVRKFLKKIVSFGWKPSTFSLNEVADLYIAKKDFEDILSFFIEMRSAPDIMVGNKVIHSLCSKFGINRAHSFLWELEDLGFVPNEITFGIFIGYSLDENMKDAFFFLSEILSRGLKPDIHSYDALISGLFKANLPEHTGEILNEMADNGVKPNLSTFRALLAGYSRARQFNEVNRIMREMVNHDLIVLSTSENPIPKAFAILGLNPLTVKIKRDNDVRSFRTEFVDELGNGLYLDTNIDEFDKYVTSVLDDYIILDFNLLVLKQCDEKNVKEALRLVDEMRLWGQELSVSALSTLVRLVCEFNSHIEEIRALLDKDFKLFSNLDHETLNFVVSFLSKNEVIDLCKSLLHEMCRKKLRIFNATYTSFIVALCKFGNTKDLLNGLYLAKKDYWSPSLDDFTFILESLCHRKMIKEILELFERMLQLNPGLGNQVCDVFIENLCSFGLTKVGDTLVKEFVQKQDFELDHTIYGHLIRGYCLEKRFSEALIVFDKILANNLPMSLDALLMLIPTLCKVHRFKDVVALKEAFFEDNPVISSSLQSALIVSCCKVGNVFEVDALFREISLENTSLSEEIFNALIQVHCRKNNLKIAKELFCAIIKSEIILSVSSYRDLLSLLFRNEMFCSAQGLKSLMLVQNKIPYSIINNIFMFYLFRDGKKFLVDALFDELELSNELLDEAGYNILINGFSGWNEMPRSIKFLNDMIIKGLKPSKRSLRAVIQYLCRNEQVENALRLINHFQSKGWNLCPSIVYAILEGLFTNGNIHRAEKFLAQTMEKGKDLSFGNAYYNILIQKFCLYGRPEIALSLLDEILKEKFIPDSSSYDCIIQSFCGYNDLCRALDFFSEMLQRNLKPSIQTWVMIVRELCQKGKTMEGEGVLSLMSSVGEKPTKEMYTFVIDQYRLENNLLKASELLDRMQSVGYEPDFGTQWSVISSLSNFNNQKNKSEGFLSKLLVESGFPSENAKTK